MPTKTVNGFRVGVGAGGTILRPKISTRKSIDKNKQIEALLQIAEKNNLGGIVKPKEQKLSTLQKFGQLVNITNPTNALLAAREGRDFLSTYKQDISRRFTSGVTGKIPQETERGGAELMSSLGVKNKILKFGLGFAADVLLDPSTYVGGAVLKGALKGAKLATKPIVGAARMLAPGAVRMGEEALVGAKDALGRAFVRGYKSTPGLLEESTDILAKQDEIVRNIFKDSELRTGVLSEAQRRTVGERLAGTRRAVFEETGKIQNTIRETYKKKFGAEIPKTTNLDAIIGEVEKRAQGETTRLQKTLEFLQRDITKAETSDLTKLIADLRKQLREVGTGGAKKVAGELAPAGFRETEQFLQSTINLRRTELRGIIGELEAKLKYAKPRAVQKLAKTTRPTFSQTVKRLNERIVQVQNATAERTRLLQGYRDAFKVARERKGKLPSFADFTGKEQEIIAGEVGRARVIGQKLVNAGKLSQETIPEVYFPFISVDPAKLEKLLTGTRRLGPGSENYLKQFKNLLTNEDIVLDFGKAYATRTAEVVKDLYLEKQLRRLVGKYGTKDEKLASSLGFVPITRKGIAGKIGEVIGYLSREDAGLLNAFTGKSEFAILDLIAKRTGFDWATGLFKRAVTGLFAPFHVRNWVSGVIQNFEILGPHSLSPRMMAGGARLATKIIKGSSFGKETIELGGKVYQLESLMQRLKYRFFGGSFIADLGDGTRVLADSGKVISMESIKKTIKTIGLGTDAIPFRAARKVGEGIEMQQKATAFLTALDLGKNIDEALTLAKRSGFDYRQLTGFESKILRRIVPFYAFARFNAELQIRAILQNPGRISSIFKVFRNAGESFGGVATQEERESLPDYLANGFGFKVGVDRNGNPVYTSTLGTPVEAFLGWLDKNPILKVMSNMNPLLKTPLELGTGIDSFRQRDLQLVYTASEYSGAPKIVKDLLQLREVKKDKYVNGKKTGEKYTAYIANPERLLIARSLFTSRGATYLDQIFDGELKGFAKALNLTTGIKSYPVDIERTAELRNLEEQRRIEDVLVRYGAAKKFQTVYEAKKKNTISGLSL